MAGRLAEFAFASGATKANPARRTDVADKRSASGFPASPASDTIGASPSGKCITMATAKPRITVTLDPDVYETIKGLSEAQGCTMSGLVSEFLAMVNPVQQRVLRAVKKAQALNV